ATSNVVSTAGAATTVSAATTTTNDDGDITLAQALIEMKSTKPKAKIDADHQLAERMQAKEQEELSIKENATLFQQLLEKSRKHFAAKRAEEKRNKPPTKAQQRKIMVNTFENFRTELVEGKEKRAGTELDATCAHSYVGREEVSSYTIYTYNDVGKEASN
ncbi:hypothetical protein Tco_0855016, partial [Tanacetum coccineum]